jgi:hypothetical protein
MLYYRMLYVSRLYNILYYIILCIILDIKACGGEGLINAEGSFIKQEGRFDCDVHARSTLD